MMRKWYWAMLPLLLGMIAALPLTRWAGDRVLYLELNVATAAALLGGIVSLILVLVLWRAKTAQQDIARIRAQEEENRHRFMGRLDHQLKNPATAMQTGLERLSIAGLTPEQLSLFSTVWMAEDNNLPTTYSALFAG
jgi:two-component system OmpR family sensor kinase